MPPKREENCPKACVFCASEENSEENYGKLLCKHGIATHYFCMLFSSNLWQRGKKDEDGILGFLPVDIRREQKRGLRLSCYYCKKKGATVGCTVAECKKKFHFRCGRDAGGLCQFYNQFRAYCSEHRPHQASTISGSDRLAFYGTAKTSCSICCNAVQARTSNDTLRSPCCRNAWFHRKCIQRYAVSAGAYFFKCPLCNNTDQFTAEMLEFGIYIPEQDASWEQDPNAFQDLLERYSRCDAENCLCPHGPEHKGVSGSKWDIELCTSCGSSGSHSQCGALTKVRRDLVCAVCSGINGKCKAENNSKKHKSKTSIETPRVTHDTEELRKQLAQSHAASLRALRASRRRRQSMSPDPKGPESSVSSSSSRTSVASPSLFQDHRLMTCVPVVRIERAETEAEVNVTDTDEDKRSSTALSSARSRGFYQQVSRRRSGRPVCKSSEDKTGLWNVRDVIEEGSKKVLLFSTDSAISNESKPTCSEMKSKKGRPKKQLHTHTVVEDIEYIDSSSAESENSAPRISLRRPTRSFALKVKESNSTKPCESSPTVKKLKLQDARSDMKSEKTLKEPVSNVPGSSSSSQDGSKVSYPHHQPSLFSAGFSTRDSTDSSSESETGLDMKRGHALNKVSQKKTRMQKVMLERSVKSDISSEDDCIIMSSSPVLINETRSLATSTTSRPKCASVTTSWQKGLTSVCKQTPLLPKQRAQPVDEQNPSMFMEFQLRRSDSQLDAGVPSSLPLTSVIQQPLSNQPTHDTRSLMPLAVLFIPVSQATAMQQNSPAQFIISTSTSQSVPPPQTDHFPPTSSLYPDSVSVPKCQPFQHVLHSTPVTYSLPSNLAPLQERPATVATQAFPVRLTVANSIPIFQAGSQSVPPVPRAYSVVSSVQMPFHTSYSVAPTNVSKLTSPLPLPVKISPANSLIEQDTAAPSKRDPLGPVPVQFYQSQGSSGPTNVVPVALYAHSPQDIKHISPVTNIECTQPEQNHGMIEMVGSQESQLVQMNALSKPVATIMASSHPQQQHPLPSTSGYCQPASFHLSKPGPRVQSALYQPHGKMTASLAAGQSSLVGVSTKKPPSISRPVPVSLRKVSAEPSCTKSLIETPVNSLSVEKTESYDTQPVPTSQEDDKGERFLCRGKVWLSAEGSQSKVARDQFPSKTFVDDDNDSMDSVVYLADTESEEEAAVSGSSPRTAMPQSATTCSSYGNSPASFFQSTTSSPARQPTMPSSVMMHSISGNCPVPVSAVASSKSSTTLSPARQPCAFCHHNSPRPRHSCLLHGPRLVNSPLQKKLPAAPTINLTAAETAAVVANQAAHLSDSDIEIID